MSKNIVWCCCQLAYQEALCKYPFDKFVDNLPGSLSDNRFYSTNKENTVVIDDLRKSSSESNQIEKAITK